MSPRGPSVVAVLALGFGKEREKRAVKLLSLTEPLWLQIHSSLWSGFDFGVSSSAAALHLLAVFFNKACSQHVLLLSGNMFCILAVWMHWAIGERGRFCCVLPIGRFSYSRKEKGRWSRQLKCPGSYLVTLFQQGEESCLLTQYRAVLKALGFGDTSTGWRIYWPSSTTTWVLVFLCNSDRRTWEKRMWAAFQICKDGISLVCRSSRVSKQSQ